MAPTFQNGWCPSCITRFPWEENKNPEAPASKRESFSCGEGAVLNEARGGLHFLGKNGINLVWTIVMKMPRE